MSHPRAALAAFLTAAVLVPASLAPASSGSPARNGADATTTQAAAKPSAEEQYPDRELNCNEPPYRPWTELLLGNPEPMKDQALIRVNTCGINFSAGQQDSKLKITMVDGKLRFADRGTKRWNRISDNCRKVKVKKGIAAICTIPKRFQGLMFLAVWPRLGDDKIVADTLPDWIRMWVLVDAGDDTVRTGPADDFINGAFGIDKIWSGGGADWVRSGDDNDFIHAGSGDDGGSDCAHEEIRIVAGDGVDKIIGGSGEGCIYTGPGVDIVKAQDQTVDRLVCGATKDELTVDPDDKLVTCS